MKQLTGSIVIGGLGFAVFLGTSCKRQADAVRSDLNEAGYQMTAEDWFRAARENDVSALKNFATSGFDILTTDPAGNTALHVASAAGSMAAAEFLLDRKMPVDVAGEFGRTPLMAAVIADQTKMVGWLMEQGADPALKDKDGYKSLMLAVREGSEGSVAELAAANRDDLDPALLLASLVGQVTIIDALTNYGASIYARMEDGRTPLMLAAANGHLEAVKLLMDIGASRFATDPLGKSAADHANEAGHDEIAQVISREPAAGEMSLEPTEAIAQAMDAEMTRKARAPGDKVPQGALTDSDAPGSIEGKTMSSPRTASPVNGNSSDEALTDTALREPDSTPLVMRSYREREVPVSIVSVEGDTASIKVAGPVMKMVGVKTGTVIPGSNLVVVSVKRRMEDSKVNVDQPAEISVVEIRDAQTGVTRHWISGVPANAHDPIALVEDSANGKRYVASPGQKFQGADGTQFLITDVRPNQLIIQNISSGTVQTIPLRGPRG